MKDLFPHNLKAYRAVMKHFKDGHQRACIVHATGTGKSYVINAVASRFKRILVMSPNEYVLEQVRTTIREQNPKTDSRTVYKNYTKLMYDIAARETFTGAFDLIVLDEFHRTGAGKWGRAVLELLKNNPQAKVLGTSATPIRYLDGRRDMAQEIFEGQVVSELTLGEAWARGILLSPVYVVALEDFEGTNEEAKQRIGSSFLSENQKDSLTLSLNTAKKDWEAAGGLPGIIRKYIKPDMKRIIVFCRSVAEIEASSRTVSSWMGHAGLPNHRIYSLYWSKSLKKQQQQMQQFQEDEEGMIKIMLCVDMLNEGVHVRDVDAAILLRSTQSPIIYLQQIGRALSAGREHAYRPVILDLQNNIWNIHSELFTEERQRYDNCKKTRNTPKGEFIKIVDTTMDIRQLAGHIDEVCSYSNYWKEWDMNYAIAKQFFEEKGHFPTMKENPKILSWARKWYGGCYDKKYPERAKMLEDIGFSYTHNNERWMKKYNLCKAFFEKHGHFPATSENERLSSWAKEWYRQGEYKNDPEKAKMLEDIGFTYKTKDEKWMSYYNKLKEYVETHGHFPRVRDNRSLALWSYTWYKNSGKSSPERLQMLLDLGYIPPENDCNTRGK